MIACKCENEVIDSLKIYLAKLAALTIGQPKTSCSCKNDCHYS